jgi:polyisoprenoid-binding protein YceI
VSQRRGTLRVRPLAASRVAVEIATASVASGHKDRDAMLRSAVFFDVATWPRATFTSEHLMSRGGDRNEAHGRLTLRDVTRDVVLPFQLKIENSAGRRAARASGALAISRLY